MDITKRLSQVENEKPEIPLQIQNSANGSEVEEHKNKTLVGHWVLIKESKEDLRKKCEKYSKKVQKDYRGNDGESTEMPVVDTRFVADNIIVGTDSAERYLNVSGRGYRHVDGERFCSDRRFDQVNTVNADDNQLRLASFHTFKSVQKLSLRRNRLESVDPIDGDLSKTLIRLDLSENSLNPDDLYRLSTSNLEQLYVSANNLTAVPESIIDYRCFLSLEFLDLSKNRLSCPKTFYILSTLHNLQVLNMSDNQISSIPYLTSIQSLNIECINNEKDTGVYQDDEAMVYGNKDYVNELEYHVQHIPFVSLNSIDLSNNLIDQCSSVMPLICWPSLTNVILTANTISLHKNLPKFNNLKHKLSLYNIKINRL